MATSSVTLDPRAPASEPQTGQSTDALLRVVVWVCLYSVPLCVALLPNLDYDVWWHLRCGQWIVAEQTVPTTDPFSQYGLTNGKPWYAYSWLFEVLVYTAHRTAGPQGIFLGRAVLTLLIFVALHVLIARRAKHFLTAAALLGLAALGMLPLLTDRPWLFTILFSALILDVILDLRAGRPTRRVWLLPLVFVLWANLHIQFIYGLFILGLTCLAPLGDALLRRDADLTGAAKAWTRSWWTLVLVTGLCAAATLVTPYHVYVYEVVLEYATHKVPAATIAEFQSLQFRDFWDWCVLALGAWAVFALGRRSRLSCFEVLLLAAAALFAFKGRRDVWFLVLAALAIVPGTGTPLSGRGVFWPTWRQALAMASAVVLLGVAYWSYAQNDTSRANTAASHYPVKAVEFVRTNGFHGPLYNPFDWGGYLIWALPELPVAMDGRTNLHTDARIARHLDTWLGKPGWEDDGELKAARVIVADRRLPLTALLRQDALLRQNTRYAIAYEDALAVVFVASEPQRAP
jgi:hypothetical protein